MLHVPWKQLRAPIDPTGADAKGEKEFLVPGIHRLDIIINLWRLDYGFSFAEYSSDGM